MKSSSVFLIILLIKAKHDMLSATAPLALQENVSDGAKIVGRDPYGISRSYGSRWQDSRRQRYRAEYRV